MKALVGTIVGVVVLSVATVAAAQDAAKVAAGKKLYADQKCATCHQVAGQGNKMFPLDTVGTKLKPEEIKMWLTDTASMEAKLPKKPAISMASWLKTHKLSDADVEALVAYLQTLK